MKKVRQISVQIDATTFKAILPQQAGPFLLHAAYVSVTPTSGDLFPYLSIKFGGVALCAKIPTPQYLDNSNGLETFCSWIRGGAAYSPDDSAGLGGTAYAVMPLPTNMVLDSQFEVAVQIPDIVPTVDFPSAVSFLIEDVPPDAAK